MLLGTSVATVVGVLLSSFWLYGYVSALQPVPPIAITASPSPIGAGTPSAVPPSDPSPKPTSEPSPEPDLGTRVNAVLNDYFGAINRGDYAAAYARLGPDAQGKTSYEDFADGSSTSQDTDVQVRHLNGSDPSRPVAWVTFTSRQAADKGPNGLTCAEWSLDYTFLDFGGQLLINSVSAHPGGEAVTACG